MSARKICFHGEIINTFADENTLSVAMRGVNCIYA